MRPDIVTNAIGPVNGSRGRRPEENLEETAQVLGEEPGMLKRFWKRVKELYNIQ